MKNNLLNFTESIPALTKKKKRKEGKKEKKRKKEIIQAKTWP